MYIISRKNRSCIFMCCHLAYVLKARFSHTRIITVARKRASCVVRVNIQYRYMTSGECRLCAVHSSWPVLTACGVRAASSRVPFPVVSGRAPLSSFTSFTLTCGHWTGATQPPAAAGDTRSDTSRQRPALIDRFTSTSLTPHCIGRLHRHAHARAHTLARRLSI